MDIHMIANILLLGYIPTIIYIAHLKTKLNNSKLNKEIWYQTALMLEQVFLSIEGPKIKSRLHTT